MSLRSARRIFGPWLAALFLLAHVGGVIPAIYVHTSDVVSEVRLSGQPHSTHHGGAQHDEHSGLADPCCAVHHHLSAVIPPPIDAAPVDLVLRPLISLPLMATADTSPNLLDRPPKSSSPI